jgi:hypothetical protein
MRQRIGGLSKFRSFANRVAKSFGRSMVLACLLTRGALAGSLAPDEAELDRTWSAGLFSSRYFDGGQAIPKGVNV